MVTHISCFSSGIFPYIFGGVLWSPLNSCYHALQPRTHHSWWLPSMMWQFRTPWIAHGAINHRGPAVQRGKSPRDRVREPLHSERNKYRLQLCGKAKYWWTFPSQNVAIKIHHSCVKRWKQQQIPGSFPDLCDRRANFRIYKTSGTMEMGRFTSPMHMNKSCAMYPRKQQPKERALVASFRLFLYNWITSLSHI